MTFGFLGLRLLIKERWIFSKVEKILDFPILSCRHLKTRIEEHIKKENTFNIFKHLHSTTACFDPYKSLSFKIIDKANSKFDLKLKEALHINWRKPNSNTQQNPLALTISLWLLFPLFFSVFFFFFFFFNYFLDFSFIYYFHYLRH